MRRGFQTTLVGGTLAGFCFAGLATAVSLYTTSEFSPAASRPAGTSPGSSFQAQRVNSLLGMKVENRDSQYLGWVKDFIVNFRTGNVTCALICSGGFLGLGARLRAVPIQDLSPATTQRGILELDISLARWRQTPPVRLGNGVLLASDIIGESVLNRSGRKVAEVVDLLVDVGGGRPAIAVLSPTAAFKPPRQGTVTVPLGVLAPTSGDQVILKTSQLSLLTKG